MIANVSAHRRANAFAEALDEQQAAEGRTAEQTGASAADEQGRLLALADELQALPKPALDTDVKTVQRAQLVAAMEAMFAEGDGTDGPQVPEQRSRKGAHRAGPLRTLRPRSRWSQGLAAGGLTVGVAAGALTGAAAASSSALPGDSLYGLKRGMEDLKLNLAQGEADRGRVYLDQASTRMNEARRLMERGRRGDLDPESVGEIRKALSGMQHDASEGHRLLSSAYAHSGSLDPIQTLETFSSSHRESWRELRDRLPDQLYDVGAEVSSVFDAMDQEVGPLKSLLPPDSGTGRSAKGHDGRSTGPGGPARRGDQSASASGTPDHRRGNGGPRPQPTDSQLDQRLIGGTSDLINPQESGSPAPTGRAGDSGGKAPKPEITLPPLLPGILPGLGINGEDAK